MSDKVDHVRQAGQTRNHTCHWPYCKVQVPPAMWGCRTHWYTLPKELRRKLWDVYVPGQEEDMSLVSEKYLAVAQEIQAWIERYHPEAVK